MHIWHIAQIHVFNFEKNTERFSFFIKQLMENEYFELYETLWNQNCKGKFIFLLLN